MYPLRGLDRVLGLRPLWDCGEVGDSDYLSPGADDCCDGLFLDLRRCDLRGLLLGPDGSMTMFYRGLYSWLCGHIDEFDSDAGSVSVEVEVEAGLPQSLRLRDRYPLPFPLLRPNR